MVLAFESTIPREASDDDDDEFREPPLQNGSDCWHPNTPKNRMDGSKVMMHVFPSLKQPRKMMKKLIICK